MGMSRLILQLSLCVTTVIQLTLSQPTYDVIEQDNDDVCSSCCERTEQALNQYTLALNQLVTVNARMLTALSQLEKDVAELKAATALKNTTGLTQ